MIGMYEITSDPDCRWCSLVDGVPSDCTCRPEGCGHPNCSPLEEEQR